MDSGVGGVVQEDRVEGDLVEEVQDGLRRIGKEPSEYRSRSSEVDV